MSLDKAIEYGKEKRKQYHGAQAVDKTCRCGGTCGYCRGNRLYSTNKRLQEMKEKIDDYKKGDL